MIQPLPGVRVVDRATLDVLRAGHVRLLALRSAGYNHVDLAAAAALGIPVVRVPEYSPHAVAEHAVALVLTLNRLDEGPGARDRAYAGRGPSSGTSSSS